MQRTARLQRTLNILIADDDGLTVLTALHRRLPHMAILMVTGQGDELPAGIRTVPSPALQRQI